MTLLRGCQHSLARIRQTASWNRSTRYGEMCHGSRSAEVVAEVRFAMRAGDSLDRHCRAGLLAGIGSLGEAGRVLRFRAVVREAEDSGDPAPGGVHQVEERGDGDLEVEPGPRISHVMQIIL